MKMGTFLSVALSLVCFAGVAQGQNALTASNETAAGGTANVTISLDSVDVLQGWSFGLCNGADVAATAVADGAATAAFNGGAGADFNQVNLFADGWTVGVVISFLGMDELAPGTGLELHGADYDALSVVAAGDPDIVASLDFCATLGAPPVATVVVVGGASVSPDQNSGSITIAGAPPMPPSFQYIAPNDEVAATAANFSANFAIFRDPAGEALPTEDTQGFSMGCSNDAIIAPTAVSAIGELADVAGGAGPDFFGDNTAPEGWTVGVVYAFLGGVFIQFDVAKEVISVDYDNVSAVALDVAALTWVDTLGMPPVSNVVVVGGQSIGTAGVDGSITFSDTPSVTFLRGDCNDDGIVNIADGVWIINELFLSGPSSPCAAACDANDDDMIDQSDAVYIWNYRFLDGPAPQGGLECQTSDDAGDVDLGCDGGSC